MQTNNPSMIEITLPDGNIKKFSKGISVYDIAKEISEGLARNVLSAKFNNQIIETSTIILNDSSRVIKEDRFNEKYTKSYIFIEEI